MLSYHKRKALQGRTLGQSSIIIILLLLLLTACTTPAPAQPTTIPSGEEAAPEGPSRGGNLVVALPGDVGAVDPAFAYDFTTNAVVTQVTEGLLRYDDEMKLQPALAESWENPDPLTYIYHLREGVTFSDGTPMTIDDVIFSMERVRDPATASTLGWTYENVDTIEKVDDNTLKVTLSQPDALWQYAVATTAGHVISQSYYQENQEKFGKPDAPLIGTGPFKIESWQPGTEIVLVRNENYWDKENGPYLDQVTFSILPDATARVTALKTEDAHMTIGPGSVSIDQFSIVEDMDNVELVKETGFQVDYIVFNNQRDPFTELNVRQAIYHALDLNQIVEEIIKDGGVKAKPTMITPAMWVFEEEKFEEAYEALPEYPHDLDRAKELLSQTSVPDGFDAVITTDADPVRLNVALQVQAAVEPLGINLEVEQVTFQELVNRIQFTLDYDMAMDVWASDFPDPSGNLYPTHISTNIGEGGANQSLYVNEEVDELLFQQNSLTDNSQRAELLIQAQEIIAQEVPEVIIDYPYLPMAINKSFTGYTLTPMWFWQAWAKDIHRVSE